MRQFIVNYIRLFLPNFYVTVGILPFFIFLSIIPSLFYGYYYYTAKIIRFDNAPNSQLKSYNTCYTVVVFLDKDNQEQYSQELCDNFNLENDLGKNILVRIDRGPKSKWNLIGSFQKGSGPFNSVISIEGRQINSKYDMPWLFLSLSLLGLLMFILWIKNSLVPRIKGTHPLQVELKKRKSE